MSDMLQLVVAIHNTQAMIPLVLWHIELLNPDDKLKHVGHDEPSMLFAEITGEILDESLPALKSLFIYCDGI